MFVLVAYDICTDTKAGQKRLRKVAQACQRVGQRVQKSVFECTLDEVRFVGLVRTLSRIMDKSEDNIRIYCLGEQRPRNIVQLGRSSAVNFEDPLIL
ncbi:CRISPR-associated endonuclease Cas2 [Kyrpidia tusciae]|uniref:CRISPR-associated endoribonuclease Cas2 n=1 Tax=Kyrpidia tusciae (strain DSM 2912 / NBRC 15312 / T2) TaxID=562970 RepID=D5WU79_KYRT2|nr:CRISPR-associated endonuclease Cas2 [Kyrpidia tusciae]ADG07331.1 CRISPR-associated protein Cas2 [Kyrpidia tusciae DSM 2912]